MKDDELAIWLALHSLSGSGFGPKSVLRLVERLGSAREVWSASKERLVDEARMTPDSAEKFVGRRENVDPAVLLAALKKADITALPFLHPFYPPLLRQIHDPPTILFVRGAMEETDFDHVIGVVGTRNPTTYGTRLAKDVARRLSADGVTVASGLALGIDSLAHWGAIEGGGRTLAVVATGPDICYPSSNKRLYQAILEGRGIIVSEYFPGTKPEKWHFPARNRIVSGISGGLLVVEAGENSGALISARLAFEQSREVFAFPGRVDSPMSIGTNQLIAKNVAHLIRDHNDVLDVMNWVKTSVREVTTVVELFGREKEIYELLSNEPTHFDVLCEQTGVQAGEMSATLTMLELAGLVTRHPGDWYSRPENSNVAQQTPTLPGTN